MIHSWSWCVFWSPVVLKCTGRWPSNHACYGSSNHFLRSVDSEKWPGNKALKSKDATQSFKSATSRSPAFPSNFQSVRTPVLDAKFSSLRSITFSAVQLPIFSALHFHSTRYGFELFTSFLQVPWSSHSNNQKIYTDGQLVIMQPLLMKDKFSIQ